MKYFIFSLLFTFNVNLFSQYSFEILFSSPNTEGFGDLIEEESGGFLAVGFEGELDPQEDSYVGLIARISKYGDTTLHRYYDADTGYLFTKILKSYDNHYYVFGSSVRFPQEQNYNLLVIKLDTSLNVIWKKVYDFGEQRHYPKAILETKDHGFYLISDIMKDFIHYTFLCRLDKDCDTIKWNIIDEFAGSRVNSAVYSMDSSQLYLFGTGFGTGAASKVVYDTSYNFINNTFLPANVHPNMQAKWITDTTLLFASGYFDLEPGPQSDDIAITETDSSFLNLNFTIFSSEDTIDYSADITTIDFKDRDSIFLLGTHNIIFGIWSQEVSWISLKLLDKNLVPRSSLFFGGDAYYRSWNILSTTDGGCLISAFRYDYQVQNEENDMYIIKLAKEDIITHNDYEQSHDPSNVLIYPNPGNNIVNILNPHKGSVFSLFNSQGTLVKNIILNTGRNIVITNNIESGVYFYKITYNSNTIANGSWIKTSN